MHSLNGLEKADHRLIFDPMKFVSTDGATGMGEGPLAVLKSAGENLTTDQKSRLIQAMFRTRRRSCRRDTVKLQEK